MKTLNDAPVNKIPWNKGKIIGQEPALKLKELIVVKYYTHLIIYVSVRIENNGKG